MIAQYAPYAMAVLLAAAFLLEIRTGRIPNWLSALPFVLFAIIFVMAEDRSVLIWQMVLAVSVFAFGLGMFAIGGMGAGAVKLMTGTVLFIPFENAFYALLVYFAVFFTSTLIFVQIRKYFGSEDSNWHLMANAVLPLSFTIGVAGISGMFLF
ncbi:prepilin peptidase [Yoonia sp.]|uniref:prepilin peptidase n=1 Tax=Yoonia sp. TaxID=2212373 RepID=UPI0023B70962